MSSAISSADAWACRVSSRRIAYMRTHRVAPAVTAALTATSSHTFDRMVMLVILPRRGGNRKSASLASSQNKKSPRKARPRGLFRAGTTRRNLTARATGRALLRGLFAFLLLGLLGLLALLLGRLLGLASGGGARRRRKPVGRWRTGWRRRGRARQCGSASWWSPCSWVRRPGRPVRRPVLAAGMPRASRRPCPAFSRTSRIPTLASSRTRGALLPSRPPTV